LAGAVIVCLAIVIGIFFIIRGGNKDSTGSQQELPPPLEEFPTFEAPEPQFGFHSTSAYNNLPVKGNLQVNIEVKDYPDNLETLNVYEIVPPVQDEEDFREFAAKFRLTGDIRGGERGVSMREGSCVVKYFASEEALEFWDEELTKYPTEMPDVPSEDECKEIAWDMAEELNLLTPEAEIVATSAGGGTIHEEGDIDTIFYRDIVISRNLDGFRLRGPGMQLRLTIGDGGRLERLRDNLREIKLYGTYPIRPLEEAIQDAQQGINTINLEYEVENPRVNCASILYYADISCPENRLLFPVYSLVGDTCIYVPAIKIEQPLTNRFQLSSMQ
jgi:hypothetical protein